MMKIACMLMMLIGMAHRSFSQELKFDSLSSKSLMLDSLVVDENVGLQQVEKPKVLHAEPLYIDLIRDLGARKGEKEWNIGLGMTNKNGFDKYGALVEYEWAVIDRLGLEIELPATFYSRRGPDSADIALPSNRLESLQCAAQWSFLVSEKSAVTLALGYLHEFKLADLVLWGHGNIYTGNVFNPFFVAAKRWGQNFHSLIYTGPRIKQSFTGSTGATYNINTSFHYMPWQGRNFIGLEINLEIYEGQLTTILRPQLRVVLSENFLVGCVTGIPIHSQPSGLSSFVRIIYEPH